MSFARPEYYLKVRGRKRLGVYRKRIMPPPRPGKTGRIAAGRSANRDTGESRYIPLPSANLREARPCRYAVENRSTVFCVGLELRQHRCKIWIRSPAHLADPEDLDASRCGNGLYPVHSSSGCSSGHGGARSDGSATRPRLLAVWFAVLYTWERGCTTSRSSSNCTGRIRPSLASKEPHVAPLLTPLRRR